MSYFLNYLCISRLALFVFVIFSWHVNAESFAIFKTETKPSLGDISGFDAKDLCSVAANTAKYINNHPEDHFAVHAGKVFNKQHITLQRVKNTLAFVCKTYHDDLKAKRNSRLIDSHFLTENFEFIRWMPDKKSASAIAKTSTNDVKSRLLNQIPDSEIFLTKYYTKLLTGSDVKTADFSQALYALPFDEQGMTLEQAEQKKATLTRYQLTRQQIIDGALLKNKKAQPLVWISEAALHDVLLQGTGVLKVNGKTRFFNVHRNNGISYNYSIGKTEQPRYWYFAEVQSILGYGEELSEKIPIRSHVSFAGNVADLGLGKLIMVSYLVNGKQTSRLGILADQGGAFDDNLFQLDMLVDSYQGWSDYHQANKHLPDYAQAWILVMKEIHIN